MTSNFRPLAMLLAATMLAAVPSLSQAERVAKVLPDFSVFVDPPTGFVFVKLPSGWKFVGQVQAPDLARLPASVETALLMDADDVTPLQRPVSLADR